MKIHKKDPELQRVQAQGWISQVLGFHNMEIEARFTAYRQQVMSSVLKLWTLFGTAAVVATLVRREWTQCAMNFGLLLQALRFLALRHYVGSSNSLMVSALQVASFPVRAFALVTCSVYFSVASQKVTQLVPLFGVYDSVLFPCIEQGPFKLWFLLYMTTMLPAWVMLLLNVTSLVGAVTISLGMGLVANTITFSLEAFNRRHFLAFCCATGDHSSVSSSTSVSGVPSSQGTGTPLELEAVRAANITTFDEMTDVELMELREELFAPPSLTDFRSAARPLSTFHLRLPDGDPDQLQHGTKEKLMREVAKMCPGLRVLGCVVRRGSLLLAVDVVSSSVDSDVSKCRQGQDQGLQQEQFEVVEQQLTSIMPAQWLQWLGLPNNMAMSTQVVHHPDFRTSCLSHVPLVVTLPPSYASEAPSVSLTCGNLQPGHSLRATYLGTNAPVSMVPVVDNDATAGTVEVNAVVQDPTAAAPGSQPRPGLLMLECWSSVSHSVEASAPVLVLQAGQERAAEELRNDISAAAVGLGGKESIEAAAARDAGLPCARQLIATLGWWLDMCGRPMDESGSPSEAAGTRQLLRHVGTRLLRLVVHQGRPATARLVLQALVGNRACGDTTLESVCSGEGQPLQRSILHLAMLSGCRAMVEEVMDWGTARGDPSAAGCWWALDQDGTTPLHIAALVDGGAIISKLLDASKGARQAWACLKGRRGLTPAELAERVARIVASGGGPVRGRGPVSVAPSNTDFDDLSSTPVSYDDVAAPDQVPVHKWAVIPAQGAIGAAGTEVAQNDACCATAAHDAGLQMGTKAAVKFNRAPGHGDGDAARAAQPAHHAAADAASPAPGPAPVATLLSTWLGFPDSALEAEYQAFKARAQKTMVGTWCLVKLVTMAITVLRAAAMVKDPLLPGLTSMLLLAAPYAILLYIQYCFGRPAPSACGATPCSQAEAFVQAAIEPLYVLSGLVRPVVHALWATGTLRYPPVTLHDWIVVYVCEMCCRHVMEQVRFPIMLLLDVLGVATVAAVWGAMGAARSLLLSFMAHTLALGIHTVADLRNRRAFLRCGGATACSLRTSAAGSKHAHDASLAAPPSASNRYRMKRE